MRLVIDGQRLTADRTGVGRCLEGLLSEWARSGWPLDEVVLVARDPKGLARVPDSDGLTRRVVGAGWPGLIWETCGLGRILRRGDLLFAPANLVPWNWRGATVAVLYDTLPWSASESFPWHVRLRFNGRYRLAARRADRVIVPSRATARDVMRVHSLPPSRVTVAFPGPEPRFQPLPPEHPLVRQAKTGLGIEANPFFLFVGKRSRRRNVPALLEAFARHRVRFPTHRLVFVGPGGGTMLPGSDSGVVDGGHVTEDLLHGLLASARALFYPSNYEGFGLPVVEALACGCPVVTLRNSALTESGGEAAFYLDSPGLAELERAFDQFSFDDETRREVIARGLLHVKQFTTSSFASAIKTEIQAVASGASRSSHAVAARLRRDDDGQSA